MWPCTTYFVSSVRKEGRKEIFILAKYRATYRYNITVEQVSGNYPYPAWITPVMQQGLIF